jgi:hypothetical protein
MILVPFRRPNLPFAPRILEWEWASKTYTARWRAAETTAPPSWRPPFGGVALIFASSVPPPEFLIASLVTAGVKVLSKHPTFSRGFQLRQIHPLKGCSCTKRVPFRYHFDEKQLLIVGATASRFSLARIVKPAAAGRVTSGSIQ